MSKWVARVLVPAHRWLLVSATAILAIATTFVAENAAEVGNWLALAGAGLLMYLADVFREVDSASRDLARKSERPRRETVVDVFEAEAPPRVCLAVMVIGASLVAAGLTLHWHARPAAAGHKHVNKPVHSSVRR